MPVLENVKIEWAQVKRPNQWGKYQVTAVQLTQDHINQLKELGLSPINKGDERGFYIPFKRSASFVSKKTGEEVTMEPPRVTDAKLRPFDGLIGNGSLANIQFSVFDTVNPENNKPIRSRTLESIQILELVHYEAPESDGLRASDDELKPADGFEAGDEDDDGEAPFDTSDEYTD